MPVNEDKVDERESSRSDATREQIKSRMAEEFGPVDDLALQEIVPIHDEVHVAINVIRPNDMSRHLTLFTTGMSDQPMTVPAGQESYQYAELVMHLPPDWPVPTDLAESGDSLWPFQWLRDIAYYPHHNESWLGGAHTIISSDDPPVPLGPNTKQSCLLLIADFADWSPLALDDGRSIRFYTVFPIYTEERDFEIKHGVVPLLERFQQAGIITVVDVDRKNVGVE